MRPARPAPMIVDTEVPSITSLTGGTTTSSPNIARLNLNPDMGAGLKIGFGFPSAVVENIEITLLAAYKRPGKAMSVLLPQLAGAAKTRTLALFAFSIASKMSEYSVLKPDGMVM